MHMDKKKTGLHILTDNTAVPDTLLDHYLDLGLSPEEVLFLVILLRIKKTNVELNFRNAEKHSAYTLAEIKELTPVLIDKGFLCLTNEGEILLDGMIEKLFEIWSWNAVKAEKKVPKIRKNAKGNKAFATLYQSFEQEMGRPLSPIEGEQITYWFENQKIPAELIQEGLKRAVLLGKYNFRYIEAILMAWRQEGILSVADLLKAEENKKNEKKNRNKPEQRSGRSYRGDQEDIFNDDIYEVF